MSFPSDEQKPAVYGTGSLIVSASAGAGKTAVLAERVLWLIAERNIRIERMLILTFTRAAASEMKSRISARILEEAEKDPTRAAYFREQAAAVANASISTIDAFCAKILERHFFRVGLSPACRLLDTSQEKVLEAETRSAALDALAEEDPEAYRTLVVAFGGDKQLNETMDAFTKFLSSLLDPEGWLNQKEAELDDPAALQRQLAFQLARDKNELRLGIDELQRRTDAVPRACERILNILYEVLSHARGALQMESRGDYAQALSAVIGVRGNLTFPEGVSDAEKKPAQNARRRLNSLCREQIERYTVPEEELRIAEQQAIPVLKAFYALIRTYLAAYRDAKREQNAMSFSDLEYRAIEILKDDEIAAEYRERYQTIFVDEYQDSNRIQEAILSRIARPDTLFYVGDVKQSIYRFRKAEPALFLEKCEEFRGERGTRVDLTENFRSGQAVIDAVNAVFEQAMRKPIAGIEYDARAALKKGNATAPDGKAELHIVSADADPDDEETLENVKAEARLVAQMINERRSRPVVQNGKERECRFEDFAVLLRRKKYFGVWERALTDAGIACYSSGSDGIFSAIEVKLVMSLLSVLDNRRQDIPLLAVMRSPMFGFTDGDLAKICVGKGKKPLLDCLLAARDTDPKVAAFLKQIERLEALSRRIPLSDLVERILDETHYRELMGVLAGGSQRVENLNALVRMAEECDASGMSGIHGFLRFMKKLESVKDAGESKAVTANAVRIMTVHGSKGLQFPFVYYAELSGGFSKQDVKGALIPDPELGVGLQYFDDYGVPYETQTFRNAKSVVEDAIWAEELRVMYVAMTRAKQELYLIGSLKNPERAIDKLDLPTLLPIKQSTTPLKILMLTLNGRVPWTVHQKKEFYLTAGNTSQTPIPQPREEERAALREQFEWVYPYPIADTLPDKTSVTGLMRSSVPEFDEPAFETGYDVLSEGSAVHRALECMPLRDEAKRAAYLRELPGVSPFHAEAIRRFAASPLFARMAASARVEREWSFLCPMPAERLLPDADSDGSILLQGVIDACFLEDGAWVLLDYKTDRVTGDPKEYAKKHAHQVALYAEALEKLSGIPVKERFIVLLGANAEVAI